VYREAKSWADVVEGLRHVKVPENEMIRVLVIGSPAPLIDAITERGFTGLKGARRGTVAVFSYRRRYGRNSRKVAAGDFVVAPSEHGDVYFLAYVGGRGFLRFGLAPLIDRLYPKVARPFLTQSELQGVLRNLQRAVKPDALRIQEYSAKRRLRSSRKKFESLRNWTDADLDVSFREAAERNVWFQSVRFEIARGGEERGHWRGMRGLVSKYGLVAVDRGIELVDRVVIPDLVRITRDRLKLLSNRDRVSAPDHASMPLEITYEKPVLRTPDDIKRLLDGLRRFPSGTCTVLHGNPYLHVSIVDNLDFSAADVWVLRDRSILIVPQLRASYAALKRLVNHIFENFREGRLGESKESSEEAAS
jgi:hypothetical protein